MRSLRGCSPGDVRVNPDDMPLHMGDARRDFRRG
jgi:hypothetical protein